MTTKQKSRKAPAAAIDPIFAAIAEHKALMKESASHEDKCRTARDEAEKQHGEWIEHVRRYGSKDPWPGEAIVSPLYDRWCGAERAADKAAVRMARTTPATPAGAAAMIVHVRREIAASNREDWEDWVTIALKTAADMLARMKVA